MLLNMIVVLEEKWIFIWKKLLLLSLFDYTGKAKKKKVYLWQIYLRKYKNQRPSDTNFDENK